MKVRVRYVIRHVRAGLKYGYPLCCILRFATGRGYQGVRRGVHYRRDGEVYWVPCGVFHRAHRSSAESTIANRFRWASYMSRLDDLLKTSPELLLHDGRLLYRAHGDGGEWTVFE